MQQFQLLLAFFELAVDVALQRGKHLVRQVQELVHLRYLPALRHVAEQLLCVFFGELGHFLLFLHQLLALQLSDDGQGGEG